MGRGGEHPGPPNKLNFRLPTELLLLPFRAGHIHPRLHPTVAHAAGSSYTLTQPDMCMEARIHPSMQPVWLLPDRGRTPKSQQHAQLMCHSTQKSSKECRNLKCSFKLYTAPPSLCQCYWACTSWCRASRASSPETSSTWCALRPPLVMQSHGSRYRFCKTAL